MARTKKVVSKVTSHVSQDVNKGRKVRGRLSIRRELTDDMVRKFLEVKSR